MGLYVNRGNQGFREIKTERYVDKTGLIAKMNRLLNTEYRLICVSRPRRFGKTYAAQMLMGYYGRGCDSSELFDDLMIAGNPDYRVHMNQYHVIYVDMASFSPKIGASELPEHVEDLIRRDLEKDFPKVEPAPDLKDYLAEVVRRGVDEEGRTHKFIFIIDEWDYILRNQRSTEADKENYLDFLRTFFKSDITREVFAGAYITGILPIKKDGSQSALSEFQEYTMLKPGTFAPYVGFTEDEVHRLCEKYDMDFSKMKFWYDGYALKGAGEVYNSNSVMRAIHERDFDDYWVATAAWDSLVRYLNKDYEGLGRDVVELFAGRPVAMVTQTFQNDMAEVASRDDVLTLLVHFGYLSYDEKGKSAHIPNEEIRLEFAGSVRQIKHADTIRRVMESDQLMRDIVARDAKAVAAQIQKVHMEENEPRHYNSEEALRATLKLALFSYKDLYTQFEELPGGTGYADMVYLPKKGSRMPIFVIELKKDITPEGAIAQIRSRRYADKYTDWDEEILLVGITYDSSDPEKKHYCMIEEYVKET